MVLSEKNEDAKKSVLRHESLDVPELAEMNKVDQSGCPTISGCRIMQKLDNSTYAMSSNCESMKESLSTCLPNPFIWHDRMSGQKVCPCWNPTPIHVPQKLELYRNCLTCHMECYPDKLKKNEGGAWKKVLTTRCCSLYITQCDNWGRLWSYPETVQVVKIGCYPVGIPVSGSSGSRPVKSEDWDMEGGQPGELGCGLAIWTKVSVPELNRTVQSLVMPFDEKRRCLRERRCFVTGKAESCRNSRNALRRKEKVSERTAMFRDRESGAVSKFPKERHGLSETKA